MVVAGARDLAGAKPGGSVQLAEMMLYRKKTNHELSLSGAHVIIVIGELELGGAERQAILLARHLAHEQKADVEVWGYGKPGRAAELCEEFGITWRSVPIPLPWSLNRLVQLKRLLKFAMVLRRAKPDVILPFMFFESVVCGLVWPLTGAQVCLWNQRCEGRDRLGRWAEKLAIRFTPRFIANSVHGADFLVKTLGVNPDAVQVVHNGVALAPAQWNRDKWRQHLGVADDIFLACMVANLHVFKDHVTLLKAWRIVVDHFKPMDRQPVLLLAGRFDGTQDRLKLLAEDLELGDAVRFLGAVKDVSGLLSSVDLGVHSSVNEGCPNGVLESMAAGLAVAGTDYPGIREAVGPNGYDFLASPGDPEVLARRIVALALDPQARRKAGAANRLRIETEFNPRTMSRKIVALIGAALDKTEPVPSISSGGTVMAENHEAR